MCDQGPGSGVCRFRLLPALSGGVTVRLASHQNLTWRTQDRRERHVAKRGQARCQRVRRLLPPREPNGRHSFGYACCSRVPMRTSTDTQAWQHNGFYALDGARADQLLGRHIHHERGNPANPRPGTSTSKGVGSTTPSERATRRPLGVSLVPCRWARRSDESREGRHMAESGKNCVQCARPVAIFSGITINGVAYHAHCWNHGGTPVPTSPDQAHPSGGGHGDLAYARPRVMPAVEPLQLGNTRF